MWRLLFFPVLSAVVIMVSSCSTVSYRRPSYLVPGDTIGVISMSSRMRPDSDTSALRHLMDSLGFGLIYGRHILDQCDSSFGADDRTRADEFNWMVKNPGVKAILLYRGGYGAVRTLDDIDWRGFRRRPKWVMGYSDVTMLHLAAQKRRIETIHSDMPVSFANDSVSVTSLIQAATGKLDTILIAPHALNQPGRATGRLVGGNLSILYAAGGTPEEKTLKSKGSILFIEEVGEKLYHVDRMMQSLERGGKLARCKAVVIGHMTNITDLERFGVGSAEELISRYTLKYKIPVIFGMPAGHQHPNLSMYMGRMVEVEVAGDKSATIRFR